MELLNIFYAAKKALFNHVGCGEVYSGNIIADFTRCYWQLNNTDELATKITYTENKELLEIRGEGCQRSIFKSPSEIKSIYRGKSITMVHTINARDCIDCFFYNDMEIKAKQENKCAYADSMKSSKEGE